MVLYGASRGPLFPKPVSWLGLFFHFLQQTSANHMSRFCFYQCQKLEPPPLLSIQVPPVRISTLAMHAFLGDLYRGVSRIISILGEQHDAWMLEAP